MVDIKLPSPSVNPVIKKGLRVLLELAPTLKLLVVNFLKVKLIEEKVLAEKYLLSCENL